MGRKRTQDFNLPPRMQRKGTRYYYVCNEKPRRWIPLGADLATAKRRWAELDAGTPQGMSVGDLVLRYIDRSDRPPTTLAQYMSYQRALADAFPIPAAQLRSQHVALWRELPAQRARLTYTHGCIGLLSSAFRLGAEQWLCEPLTVRRERLTGRDRVLEPGEFRAIRACAVEWLQVAMDIGYLTSQRPSDIRSARWSQVVEEQLLFTQQKTGQRLAVTITSDLRGVLERARQRPILGLYIVATAKGRPVSKDMMSDAWIAACEAAGVLDAQFRDIRAMAAKAAEEGGQDFQALLGHTTRAMSERYLKGRRTIKAEPVRRKL